MNLPLDITRVNYDNQRLKVEVPAGDLRESSYLISIRPVSTDQNMQEAITLHVRFNELERDILIYGQVR